MGPQAGWTCSLSLLHYVLVQGNILVTLCSYNINNDQRRHTNSHIIPRFRRHTLWAAEDREKVYMVAGEENEAMRSDMYSPRHVITPSPRTPYYVLYQLVAAVGLDSTSAGEADGNVFCAVFTDPTCLVPWSFRVPGRVFAYRVLHFYLV